MTSISAADTATYVRYQRANLERGTLLVRVTATGNAVACLFGNDNFHANVLAHRELELLQPYLEQLGFHDVGIGFSQDKHSWAILVEIDVLPFNTLAGRTFHIEMVRAFLEDLVVKAWREAVREARE